MTEPVTITMKHIHTGHTIQVELGANSTEARMHIENAEWLNYRGDPKEMMDAIRSLDKLNIGEDVPEFEPAYGMEFFNDPDCFEFNPPADKVMFPDKTEEEEKRGAR